MRAVLGPEPYPCYGLGPRTPLLPVRVPALPQRMIPCPCSAWSLRRRSPAAAEAAYVAVSATGHYKESEGLAAVPCTA